MRGISVHRAWSDAAFWIIVSIVAATSFSIARGQEPPRAGEIVLREGLVIPPVGQGGRSPIHTDAIEAEIVAGMWKAPKDGDEVRLTDGATRKWEPIRAGDDATFRHRSLGGGYVYISVPSDSERVMLLDAAGHSLVYVNGEPRAGDPYSHGYVRLPVRLRAGANDFLFLVQRGSLRAKLTEPAGPAIIDTSDTTLPDLVVGEKIDTWGAVVVANASSTPTDSLSIEATLPGEESVNENVPALLPFSTRKIGFRLSGAAPDADGTCTIELKLVRGEGAAREVLDSKTIQLAVVSPERPRKRTFFSDIDGSVQYYAIVQAKPNDPTSTNDDAQQSDAHRSSLDAQRVPGLVLTLHGAGVEAIGQARCFSPKPDFHVVAPTNRRPFGFDWEDWGRLDAMEVLDLVEREFGTDPRRTYLTGHSMGGHGTWHIGATFPARFAAIGPSAGWVSLWSYGAARQPNEPKSDDAKLAKLLDLLQRPTNPSNTLGLLNNYATHGVFVLHGDKDDNVPVDQARTMRKRLAEFHSDFTYYERPGAGHWWGNECVDWPAMFDFFRARATPAPGEIRHVDFTTANPGVSDRSHWIGIEAQLEQLAPSTVRIDHDPSKRRFSGKTENVARLWFALSHLTEGDPVQVELDGQKLDDIAWPDESAGRFITLARADDRWHVTASPPLSMKGPHRSGPFKDAFRHRVQFVYGTHGTDAENAWARAKARYDAERFWYQGNASVEVLSDDEFPKEGGNPFGCVLFERNVILYGNADSNAAWPELLGESPVQVRRGEVVIGDRREVGDNLACLFIRPRPGSEITSIGVVAGSGVVGMRLADRLPIFTSGVAYPDCIVIGSDSLRTGASGIRAAGFFGQDWTVESGEFVWRQE